MENHNSTVSLICTGSELTNGFYTNSNGKEISAALYKENFNIVYHICVPDDKQAILNALDFCSKLSEVIILTGGLGPTEDDLTREVLAQHLKQELVCHLDSENHIKNRMSLFGLAYKSSFAKMACFPKGALIHTNYVGSANGCTVVDSANTYCMLPGPPKECLEMFSHDVLPYLTSRFKNSVWIKKSWKVIGLVENDVDLIFKDLSRLTRYSICWRYPYVEVSAAWTEQDSAVLQTHLQVIQRKLQDHCISEIEEPYSEHLNKILDASETLLDIKVVSSSPVINKLFQKLTIHKNQKKILKIDYEVEYKNDHKDGVIKIYFQQKMILRLPFRDDNYEIFLKEWISFKILQITNSSQP